ncbi:hypothetical protein PPTG_23656 [Phytophthora nicotianae INRA-310]|uniref:Uncharacterized protein n=1 Tax=Phytophthora nicotianae (strain INRA-310) TaxID=761204 RepID=W2PVJ2_PHYN3|nr:hypothetical protein PPTG_23656 [Phytophthora nicotianae INRA-310]ETN04244.1 hypothetical protein PPTG_23656 [Phytophthora nicotianae INRA-310]
MSDDTNRTAKHIILGYFTLQANAAAMGGRMRTAWNNGMSPMMNNMQQGWNTRMNNIQSGWANGINNFKTGPANNFGVKNILNSQLTSDN